MIVLDENGNVVGWITKTDNNKVRELPVHILCQMENRRDNKRQKSVGGSKPSNK